MRRHDHHSDGLDTYDRRDTALTARRCPSTFLFSTMPRVTACVRTGSDTPTAPQLTHRHSPETQDPTEGAPALTCSATTSPAHRSHRMEHSFLSTCPDTQPSCACRTAASNSSFRNGFCTQTKFLLCVAVGGVSGPPIEQNTDAALSSDRSAPGANSERDSALSIVPRSAPAALRF